MTKKHDKPDSGTEKDDRSLEFFAQLARSEGPRMKELRKKVEEGAEHPSTDLLQNYVLDLASREEARSVMEHIALCGPCARKVLRLSWAQDPSRQEAEQASLYKALISKIRNIASEFSFQNWVSFPAAEAVRDASATKEPIKCRVGDPLIVRIKADRDGYLTVIHFSEQPPMVKLLFPTEPEDRFYVASGQETLISAQVEGPTGIQGLKVILTEDPLIDPDKIVQQSGTDNLQSLEGFFYGLERLETDEWMEAVYVYEVED